MNLAELALLVCTKCHRTDDVSIEESKVYLRSRYKMLWDSRPWRDAIGMISIPAANVTRITILPDVVDRVMAVRWGENSNLLPQDLGTIFSVDPNLFDRTGSPASFSLISPSGVQVSPNGGNIIITSTDSNASYSVSVRGILGNVEQSEVLTTSGTNNVTSAFAYDEILSLSKNSTTSALTVKDSTNSIILQTLGTKETSNACQRLHFQLSPDSDKLKPLLILFKRKIRPLNNDSDSPELTGVDNALIAAAIGDMLEAQRQYGKAQIKMQEASMMASQMADLERHQSASSAQLVPWDASMAPDDFGYADLP